MSYDYDPSNLDFNSDIGEKLEAYGEAFSDPELYSKAEKIGYLRDFLFILCIVCFIVAIVYLVKLISTSSRIIEYERLVKQTKLEYKKIKRRKDVSEEDIEDAKDQYDEMYNAYVYYCSLKFRFVKICIICTIIFFISLFSRIYIYSFGMKWVVNEVVNTVNGKDENTGDELDVGSSTSTQEIDEQYERVKTQVEEEAQKRAEEEAQYKELTQEAYKAFAGTYRGFVYDGEAYVDVQLRSDGSCTSPFYTYSDGDSANHEGTWTVVLGGNQKIDVNDDKIHIQLNWIYNGQSYSASGTLFNGYRLNINGIDYNKHF